MPDNKTMRASRKRPSVIRATLLPSPAPIIAEVGFSISGIPGPPLGPQYLDDYVSRLYCPTTNSGDDIVLIFINNSISFKISPSFPLILATQPSSARFE
jgi:hypothetical protein